MCKSVQKCTHRRKCLIWNHMQILKIKQWLERQRGSVAVDTCSLDNCGLRRKLRMVSLLNAQWPKPTLSDVSTSNHNKFEKGWNFLLLPAVVRAHVSGGLGVPGSPFQKQSHFIGEQCTAAQPVSLTNLQFNFEMLNVVVCIYLIWLCPRSVKKWLPVFISIIGNQTI